MIDYNVPLFSGTAMLGGDMLYVRRRLVDITGVAPSRTDGIIGDPEFSGQARLRYAQEDFGGTLTVTYTGEGLLNR